MPLCQGQLGYVWRGAMHGFKHGRKFFFWIEICGRGDPDRSNDGGTQVGENVAEKIGAHHNVKPIRMTYKMGSQDVDVILVRADVGILGGHGTETFIPKRHGVNDSV